MKNKIDDAIATLKKSPKNIRCSELTKLLESLGFEVKDGRNAGHKVFVHDSLNGFLSGSYDCGHGKNHEIKPCYIQKVRKTLTQFKSDLTEYLDQLEGVR